MIEERLMREDLKLVIRTSRKITECSGICLSCDAYPACPGLKQESSCPNCFGCEDFYKCIPAGII
jgi:hypothetical protein